jgi:hypothetical protein
VLKTTIGQWFCQLQAPVQWGLWTIPILEPKPFGTPINQPGLSEGTGVSVDTHLVAQDTTMEWMTCSCDIPTSYRRGVQFPGDFFPISSPKPFLLVNGLLGSYWHSQCINSQGFENRLSITMARFARGGYHGLSMFHH